MLAGICFLKSKVLIKPRTLSSSSSPLSEDLVNSVLTLLIHHRSRTRWSGLRSLLSSNRLSPSQVSQVSLALKSKPHLALRFIHFTLGHPTLFSHDFSSFATLTHILSRARLKSAARHFIRLALLSSDSYNYQDPAMKFFESLVKSYRECDSAPFVFDLLLISCLEMRKIEESMEIMRRLRSSGTTPQIVACNCLVLWTVKLKGCNEGYNIFMEVFGEEDGEIVGEKGKSKRVFPNVHSFNVLMEGFYKEGNVEMVEEIWQKMETFEVIPNGYSYSILITAFSNVGRMEEVEILWEQLRGRGIEPDLVGYNTMIGAFALLGKMERAEEIYKELQHKGIGPSCVTFEHLLKGYCENSNVDSALLIYKEMLRQRFSPQGSIISFLMEILCKEKRVSEAMEIRKVASREGCSNLSRECYELLIKGLCDEEKMHEALKIQAEMVGRGYRPHHKIYGFFIEGYEKIGNEEMALLLRKEMHGLDKIA